MFTQTMSLAYTTPTVVAEGGALDWLNGQVDQLQESFSGVLFLIASVVFLMIAGSNRTFLGFAMAFGVAVAIYWGGNSIDFGKEKIDNQVLGTDDAAVLAVGGPDVSSTVVDVT